MRKRRTPQSRFQLEELENRVLPSFVFVAGSQPAEAGATPDGARNDGTIGPSIFTAPNANPWNGPANSPVLANGDT